MLFSCVNSMKDIKTLSDLHDLPPLEGKKMVINYSDSTKIKFKLKAVEFVQIDKTEKDKKVTYLECPKGVEINIYNEFEKIKAVITSEYAIMNRVTGLVELRKNVVTKTQDQTIKTEQMFWDEKKKIIYSVKETHISGEDNIFTVLGFTSDQAFENIEHGKITGEFYFEDEKKD